MSRNTESPSIKDRKSPGRIRKALGLSLRSKDDLKSLQSNSAGRSASVSVSSFIPSVQSNDEKPIVGETREKAGLWEWPEGCDEEEGLISLVAIHGLQGDWQHTWEENGKIWLRDFLGDKINGVQVLTFGYNSMIDFSRWNHQLEDFASQLLQRLKDHRSTEQQRSRPIIFLGHSLGGLIIKKALIIAHARESTFSNITSYTKGLIFMGTPHRGADAAKWASMIQKSLGFIRVGPNTQLFEDLKVKSRTLVQINSEFRERGWNIPILSFYELYNIMPLNSLVVDKDSALLGWPRERDIGLEADHRSLCRFARSDTQAFSSVWMPIRDMVREIREVPTQNVREETKQQMLACLKKVDVRAASFSGDFDPRPTEGTCEWILSHPDYFEWYKQSPNSGLIWITGGPGSGKSILSAFVAEGIAADLTTERESNVSICKFSFNASQTAVAFIRRMIYQSLHKNSYLCNFATQYWDTGGDEMADSWESLWTFWANICENAKDGKVFWVIDALDEFHDIDKRNEFLSRLIMLVQKLNEVTIKRLCFRVFLTSRPEIWRERGLSTKLVPDRIILENEENIEKDIKLFIDTKIKDFGEKLQDEKSEKLKNLLYRGADRTFIWPALTLNAFERELGSKAYDDATWDTVLGVTPPTLDEIYEKLLLQLSGQRPFSQKPEYGPLPTEIKSLLQFILAADGYFTLSEMNVLLAVESQSSIGQTLEEKIHTIGHSTSDVYGSFVRLVKNSNGIHKVRLIHDTARKHLTKPGSDSYYAMSLKECQLELTKRCVWYLLLDDLHNIISRNLLLESDIDQPLSKIDALLHYAISHWASHYRQSEDIMDDDFLDDVVGLYRRNSQKYRDWSGAFWKTSAQTTRKYNCTPIQMCSYNGHVRILQRLLDNLDGDDIQNEISKTDVLGDTALHYATEQGHSGVVGVLLGAGVISSIRNKAGFASLHIAAIKNDYEVITVLISGGVNIDIKTTTGTAGQHSLTALHLAAERGLRDMVELLVKHGANMELLDQEGATAADRAFQRGYGEIQQFLLTRQISSGITDLDRAIIESAEDDVRTLVKHGAMLNTTDNRGLTPLHRAARGEGTEILRIILRQTTSIEIRDDDGMMPLHVASRYGRRKAVEILVEKGANVNSVSEDGSTPLHEAASSGNQAIISRLLDADADPEIFDGKHRTPLLCASRLGFKLAVEYLLQRRNRDLPMTPNEKGRLPIHMAAKYGHYETVMVLLKWNPLSIEAEDQNGCTPLSLAVNGTTESHTKTVKTLIEHRANILHKRLDGATPVLLAAKSGNLETIKCLFGEGCSIPGQIKIDPDEKDSRRSTPLSLAVAAGHESVVLFLLKNGARDVTKRESPGRREPICWAASHGMAEVITQLLQAPGIVVDSVDDDGRTPLMWAAANGHYGVASQLLEYNKRTASGIMIDHSDNESRTPLSRAAEAGYKDVVELLLRHHANPSHRSKNVYHQILGYETRTPISWAAVEGHNEVISVLLGRDISPRDFVYNDNMLSLLSLAACYGRTSTVKLLLCHNGSDILNINQGNKNGVTPLALAAYEGQEEVVRLLLAHGADVHLKTHDNKDTALTFATKQGCWIIAELLIKYDPRVLKVITAEGEHPLYLAVQNGHDETVKLLLKFGCDAKFTFRKTGNTLIHTAVKWRHHIVLDTILQHIGVMINQQNLRGQTPLWLAAINGSEECVRVLVNYCRKKEIPLDTLLVKDDQDCSILSAAVIGSNIPILRCVLKFTPKHEIGALDRFGHSPLTRASVLGNSTAILILHNQAPHNVNQIDPEWNRTPLLWAAYKGDEEVVEALLQNPLTDRYLTDKRGFTSLVLAVYSGNHNVIKLLLSDRKGDPELRKRWLNYSDISGTIFPLQHAVKTSWIYAVNLLLKEEDLDINRPNNDGETALLTAITLGDILLVKLLATSARVQSDVRDYDDRTPLMLACKGGHLNIVKFLLEHRQQFLVDVNTTDHTRMSALCHAARTGRDPEIVKLLLASNASTNHTTHPFNRSPLMLAAETGSVQVAKVLCATEGININAKDDNGFTALTIAAIENKRNMVRYLLQKGADPNVRSRRSERTPLMEAAYNGCNAVMRELSMYAGIDFTCKNDANRSATWFILNWAPSEKPSSPSEIAEMFLEFEEEKLNVNEEDLEGLTPLLLLASQPNSFLRLRRLLQLGANYRYQSWETRVSVFHEVARSGSVRAMYELLNMIDIEKPQDTEEHSVDYQDLDHGTPLSYASGNPANLPNELQNISKRLQEMDQYRIVQMLLDKRADVNSTTLKHGRTPLMFAASLGWTNIVDLLLNNGANVGRKDRTYATALSLAVEKGHIVTVRRLLEADAIRDTKDRMGATPFIIAARAGHLNLVRLFMNLFPLDLKERDRSGRTALSYAAEFGRTAIVHHLIDSQQDSRLGMIEILDRQDHTALIWAAKAGRYIITELLIECGADFRRKDRNRRMPLSHAAEHGESGIIKLLLKQETKDQLPELLNWRDDAGRTALSWAAEEGRVTALRMLLDFGANPLLSDTKNRTPRVYALEKGHTNVANILDEHKTPVVASLETESTKELEEEQVKM